MNKKYAVLGIVGVGAVIIAAVYFIQKAQVIATNTTTSATASYQNVNELAGTLNSIISGKGL
jgi:uncharacterized protein YxeA